MIVSISYILVQKIEDNIHRTNLYKIFKDRKQLTQCLIISLTPFMNFIPFFICLKVLLKSIKALINENLGNLV